jgi:hypothetical protein
MTKIETKFPLMESKRYFTLSLEAVSGSITMFYAFINSLKVIQSDGSEKRTWTGKVPDGQVRIKIRVIGIDKASFKLGLDLQGTANDQCLILYLEEGYYETDIIL